MNNNQKNKDQISSNKRRLLTSLAAGGGGSVALSTLPGAWTKPVVDTVFLPTHAMTSVICDLAASLRWNTNQADWDLGISFQGSALTGKGGSIAGLSHGGDQVPPGNNAEPVDLRETISGSALASGSYRVFARLAAVDAETSDSESGVLGSITACGSTFAIATDFPDTSIGGEVDLATVTVADDGTSTIV